jgi:hypothetical protein
MDGFLKLGGGTEFCLWLGKRIRFPELRENEEGAHKHNNNNEYEYCPKERSEAYSFPPFALEIKKDKSRYRHEKTLKKG